MRQAEIIQAAYDLLNVPSVTGLLSASYGVPAIFQIGQVPRSQSGDALFFPYVTISIPSDVDFSDKQTLGGNAIVQVDTWDRSGSAIASGLLLRAVSLATIRQEWSVPGFITCEREASDMQIDPDGLTMHGILRLRVLYIDAGNPWSPEFSEEFG
jgi:hypothetical protein